MYASRDRPRKSVKRGRKKASRCAPELLIKWQTDSRLVYRYSNSRTPRSRTVHAALHFHSTERNLIFTLKSSWEDDIFPFFFKSKVSILYCFILYIKIPIKVLGIIINAPWRVTNNALHRDLKIPTVKETIKESCQRYRGRLEEHPNDFAVNLMEAGGIARRLREEKEIY